MSARILAVIALAALCQVASADKIVIAADEWCPFVCEPGSAQEGYMVDVAKAAFATVGHSVEYRKISWDDAIAQCRKGEIAAIVGAVKDEVPDFVFPAEPQGVTSNGYFVKVGSKWSYNGVSSLDTVSLAVIEGYSYGDELDAHIKKNVANPKRIVVAKGDVALGDNIKRLLNGEVAVMVENPFVFYYSARASGAGGKFKLVGYASKPADLYIAFSPKLPKYAQYARQLSDGVALMRKTGELERILKKYTLTDWK